MKNLILFLLSLVLFSITLKNYMQRIDYKEKIRHFITAKKVQENEQIEKIMGVDWTQACSKVYISISYENHTCYNYCKQVEILSELRQQIIREVRDSFIFTKLLSEVFDYLRSIAQDRKHLLNLTQKSCSKLMESVDKSNCWINWISLALFLTSCLFLAYRSLVIAWELWQKRKAKQGTP